MSTLMGISHSSESCHSRRYDTQSSYDKSCRLASLSGEQHTLSCGMHMRLLQRPAECIKSCGDAIVRTPCAGIQLIQASEV